MSEIKDLVKYLESRGWTFYQHGEADFRWVKFDAAGHQIAVSGDGTFVADVKEFWK